MTSICVLNWWRLALKKWRLARPLKPVWLSRFKGVSYTYTCINLYACGAVDPVQPIQASLVFFFKRLKRGCFVGYANASNATSASCG